MGKKKGKSLEQIVKAIQNTLQTDKDTSIISNIKIPNTTGINREFDVVVKLNNDDSEPQYIAFECKDYSTSKKKLAIDIQYMDAFFGKCWNIPSIVRKIFVSTTGYTKNAVKEAEARGIELLCVSEVRNEDVNDRFKTSCLHIHYTLDTNNYCFTLPSSSKDELYYIPVDYLSRLMDVDLGKDVNIEEILLKEFQTKECEIQGMIAKTVWDSEKPVLQTIGLCEIVGKFQMDLIDGQQIEISSIGFPFYVNVIIENIELTRQKTLSEKNVVITEYTSKDLGIKSTMILDTEKDSYKMFYDDNGVLIAGEELV